MEKNTGHNLMRDLSELDTREILVAVVETAQRSGFSTIIPGETLATNDLISDFHARLQRLQDLEQFQPEQIESKIINGLKIRFPNREKALANSTLDKQVNALGSSLLNLESLNSLQLNKTEQLLLLRGVVLATTGRYYEAEHGGEPLSKNQRKIQATAQSCLEHMATNRVHVPTEMTDECMDKFVAAYSAAYLSKIVQREVQEQRRGPQTTSVMDGMHLPIAFGRLLSGDQDKVIPIFSEGAKRPRVLMGDKDFEPRLPSLIDEERIRDLRALQDIYGTEQTVFRYYETVQVFHKDSPNDMPGPDEKPTTHPRNKANIPEDESEDDESDAEYVLLEIEQPDNNRVRRHVVAENPKKNNACYALREEVLDEWEALIGVRLAWDDILSLKRYRVRQLGARAFHHNVGSDVPQRLRKYLLQDAQSVVLDSFDGIFGKAAGLFDENMAPTDKNRMPGLMLHYIQNSQILKKFWPLIHEHGYKQTYQMLRGQERAEVSPRFRDERVKNLQQKGEDIWKRIIEQQKKELGL